MIRRLSVPLAIGLVVVAWMYLGLADAQLWGIVAGVVGAVLLITGLVGFCPAYKLVGLSTCPLNKSPAPPAQ